MAEYFDGLIGQESLKRKLGFYLDAFKSTQRMPFLQFAGAKGYGKSAFARKVAQNVTNQDGSKRPLLEINCSVLKNMRSFFEGVYLPFIASNQGINVFFDENQNLPHDLAQALLTICNSDPNPVRNLQYEESNLEFNFERMSWFFATTETDKLFPPLKDRFEIVDFESYVTEDLKKIIALNADETVFVGNVLDSVVSCVRGNARSCVKMAENITTYCKKVDRATFGEADWKELRYSLNIMPNGLSSSEIMILKALDSRGPCSLNMLASATGLSRSAIQGDVERHLMYLGALLVDGKRKITSVGQKILKQL